MPRPSGDAPGCPPGRRPIAPWLLQLTDADLVLKHLSTTAAVFPSFTHAACSYAPCHSLQSPCSLSLPEPARCAPRPHLCRLERLPTLSRHYASPSSLAADSQPEMLPLLLDATEESHEPTPFRPQLSRNARKTLRPSRPDTILSSIDGPAKDLYVNEFSSRMTSSHTTRHRPAHQKGPQALAATSTPLQLPETPSLHSILARHVKHCTALPPPESEFQFSPAELHVLRSKGYRPESVEQWASCLVEPKCNIAARIFDQDAEVPPLFVLLIFLRRRHIRVCALGIIMRHLDRRVQTDHLEWASLKMIVVRLLRHARELWPESMPWITSFLTTQSSRFLDNAKRSSPPSHQTLSDMTRFFNSYLLLLCLPTSFRPLISATYQERAQFQILQYMAAASPPIAVTRLGFRSVARNQLARAKTPREREWAELKGPSWPPWKENRTAMDEDKGYEFGASRASQLLHRMYEAGYSHRMFDKMAQIYAGWDTDTSPTIQTRTTLPRLSSQFSDRSLIRPLLWAARIRTTRTQREAWACFLSHELSGEASHSEIYLAMFEKLHYHSVERVPIQELSPGIDRAPDEDSTHLLPGDMKEVLPDPLSSLHYVYLSEPVPAHRELLERMRKTHVKPSSRLLAFLLETYPDFQTCLDLLHMNRQGFDGGIGRILYGTHDNDASVQSIDGYLLTAIVRLLCRYGRFDRPPPWHVADFSPEEHVHQLKTNRHYLVEYAYTLLIRYRPKYRPAWAVFMEKLLHQRKIPETGHAERYKFICDLFEHIEQIDLDIDDEMFRSACKATIYAAQSVDQGAASFQDMRLLFATGSSRLRTLFNNLVGANADMHSRPEQVAGTVVPPHVPGPAELHAYVRALGTLRDYEGLYSFTTWLTKHRSEVNVRAQAQRGGSDILFRMLVALRLTVSGGGTEMGSQHASNAPEDIALLIKEQIDGVEEWGGWPTQEHVEMYIKLQLKTKSPSAGGR